VARIEPIRDASGALTHWNVSFRNDGNPGEGFSPFIGTAAFANAASKNAGKGLEAMPCPELDSGALQPIWANADYGVTAIPGEELRLGVRGLSSATVRLPANEPLEVSLNRFEKGSSASQPDFFDLQSVIDKRASKLDKVQFFRGSEAINAKIDPVTYRGADALAESDYPAPDFHVRHVAEGPGGLPGWAVEVRSRLGDTFPADFPSHFPGNFSEASLRDKPIAGQPMGFVATLGLGQDGKNAEHLAAKALRTHGAERRWFIPEGMVAEGASGQFVAEPGQKLTLGTRGMGLFSSIQLPEPGQSVHVTPDQPEHFALRPDQVAHANMTHAFFRNLRVVEDPPEL
jgi:hypothetical protein